MANPLADKSANITFVDSSGSVRQLMGDVFKAQGFKNINGLGTLQDTITMLEAEPTDWILLPLCADQPINGLQMLQLALDIPHLQNVRISLLLEESEQFVIARAFELGMFSWHPKPFTKQSFTEEIELLTKRGDANGGNTALTSAEYVRDFLTKANDNEALIQFEKGLLDVYPGNAVLLMNLAKAYQAGGKTDMAKGALMQAKLLDASQAEAIGTLANTLFGSTDLNSGAGEGFNILAVNACVIVDSDDSIRQSLKTTLNELGVTNIADFSDGEEAWEHLSKNPQPDLLMMEWRIPKITGPLLMQRARHHGFHSLPIVLISSLIKSEDMSLVREMGIASVISKPIDRTNMLKSLVWTMQQERMPTEQHAIERKIRAALVGRKMTEAKEAIAKYLATPTINEGRKKLMEAELAFATENYAQARDLSVSALKLASEGISVLNILAKSFMKLGDNINALKCFEKAQQMSPLNIERLCLIAEAHTELGNDVKAQEVIGKASDIDPDSQQVMEAGARVAVISGNTEVARAMMGQLQSASNVLSYMNNKAVASARCGKPEEGIELYEKTIASIPPDRKDLIYVVRYNIALAKIRTSDLEGALKELDAAIQDKKSRIYKRAVSLHKRVKHAIDSGADLSLSVKTDDKTAPAAAAANSSAPKKENEASDALSPEAQAVSDMHESLVVSATVQRGEFCCYLLFTSKVPHEARVTDLLKTMPKFQRRKAISRSEAMGVERGMKAAS